MEMIGLVTGAHAPETSSGWCPIPPSSNDHRAPSVEKIAQATKYPMAASIMTFASMVLCILIGLWILTTSVYVVEHYNAVIDIGFEPTGNGTIIVVTGDAGLSSNGLFIGMFSFITTGFGLVSAYLTLKKEHYRLAIIGISLVVVTSVMGILFIHQGWIVGTPTLMTAALSMAFIIFSKSEFK